MLARPKREPAAVAAHASGVAVALAATATAGGPAVWIGMVTWLGPLAALVVVGRDEPFVRAHATAALRFNLSVAAYLVVILAGVRLTAGSPYTVQFVPFFLFLNLLIAVNWILFSIVGMHRAGTGQFFTYPFSLHWPDRRVMTGRPTPRP